MDPIMATLQGELADFVVAEFNANPAAVEAAIAQAEGGIKGAIVQIFANVKPNGIAGVLMPFLARGVEGFADQLLAKYSPQEVFTMIGAWLAEEAKALGG